MLSRSFARLVRGAVCASLLVTLVPQQAVGFGSTARLEERVPPAVLRAEEPDSLLVRFKPGVDPAERRIASDRAGSAIDRPLPIVDGLVVVQLDEGTSVRDAVAAYKAMPDVLYAEPNHTVRLAQLPNDPLFGSQWGLHNIGQTVNGTAGTSDADVDAPEAWDVATGSDEVIVAVVDSGIDYDHPVLAGNLWTNIAESGGIAGIDDDGNGYVDDVHGYNTYAGNGDPRDGNGHGTGVASTIAASGNDSLAITGIAWNASLMALRFTDDAGSGTIADVIEAYAYADAMGADIINNSWGSWRAASIAERDAMAAMSDTLFVCSAGNQGLDIDAPWPGGVLGGYYYGARSDWFFYPAAYDLPNILTVGATTAVDAAANFSNRGAASVDVHAPGTDVLGATLPVTAIAPDAVIHTLFAEPFDSMTNWLAIAYAHKTWGLNTDSFTSAPSSVAMVDYVNNEISYLDQAGSLDLSTADVPVLRFKVRYDLQPDFDYFFWGVYDPAVGWPTLGVLTGDSGAGFEEVITDLSPYAGRSDIGLWFGIYTNSSVSSAEGYGGIWLDDVEVVDLDAGDSGSPWGMDYADAYGYWSGTSSSAGFVSGTMTLLLGLDGSLTAEQLKSAALNGADSLPELNGLSVTGARLNAHRTVTAPIALADEFSSSGVAVVADVGAAVVGVPLRVPAPGVLGNDVDPNGDEMAPEIVDQPLHGQISLSADGSFVYRPDAGYFGDDSFSYRAVDGSGARSATVPVTLTIADMPPVADSDVYQVAEGSVLTVASPGVLANDADPEEQSLVATLASAAAHGSVELEGDGSFTYTPDAGFVGADSFSYTATDGTTSSQPASVSIMVQADVPVYRFYNPTSGAHFYTASAAERDRVIAELPHVFTYEGTAYDTNAAKGGSPLYRFYNRFSGAHFYTASLDEKQRVELLWASVFTYEGVACTVSQFPGTGLVPVYRFYNTRNGSHFYTTSNDERDIVVQRWPDTYMLEGVGFYVSD